MKVCFHIEPYHDRNPENLRANIAKLLGRYGSHPAFYRMDGRPCFFIYDSYITPASEWARLLQPDGDLTIRGTELDAVMIGLWVKEHEEDYFTESGMDGFYTYFAATGFTYGSTPANWKKMQAWAGQNGKVFIPCVGPGYIDTRVRPWNSSTTRDRGNGKYYDDMFGAAVASGAPLHRHHLVQRVARGNADRAGSAFQLRRLHLPRLFAAGARLLPDAYRIPDFELEKIVL